MLAAGAWRPAAFAVLCAGVALAGRAQTVIDPVDRLAFDRPEAWGIRYAAAVTSMRPLAPPASLAVGEVEIAVELASVPSLSPEERRIGFGGTTEERIDRVAAFGRLRVRARSRGGFEWELGLVPPVTLRGLEPAVASLALSRRLASLGEGELSARLLGEAARIRGDLTCDSEAVAAGEDTAANPFGCERRSRDRLQLVSGAFGLYYARSVGGWRPFGGFELARLDGSFRVDARYRGVVDRTRLEAGGWTWTALAGVTVPIADRWRVAGEIDFTPASLRRAGAARESRPITDVRLLLSRRL